MANSIESFAGKLDADIGFDTFSKERLVNEFAKITQFVTWPLLKIIFFFSFKLEMNGKEVFQKTQSPILIIANHTSFYDSFIFRLVLGFRTNHLPLRFMAVNVFESEIMNLFAKIGLIDFIYSLFGVFTVTPGLGIEKNIKKAKDIIYLGGNVVVYPEGGINKSGQIGQFKNGASLIFKQTEVNVIPVSFKKTKINSFRSKINVNIGNPIIISRKNTVDNITKIFRDKVVELYNSSNRG